MTLPQRADVSQHRDKPSAGQPGGTSVARFCAPPTAILYHWVDWPCPGRLPILAPGCSTSSTRTMDTRREPPRRPDSSLKANLGKLLRVGDHVFDVGSLRLLGAAQPTRLTPKAMAVLIELARHPGRTLTRTELLDLVWASTFPTPDVLTQAIKEIRRALGDDQRSPRYIETIPKVGYRLIAEASFDEAESDESPKSVEPDAGLVHPITPGGAQGPGSWFILVAVLALAVVVFVAWRFDGNGIPQARLEPVGVTDIRVVSTTLGSEVLPHISPSGAYVAYSRTDPGTSRSRINVRNTIGSSAVELGSVAWHTGADLWPVFSPHERLLAFLRFDGGTCSYMVTPVLGGTPWRVGDCAPDALSNYFSWTPDGRALLGTFGGAINAPPRLGLLSLRDGSIVDLVYQHDGNDFDLDPRYSPDGTQIAFRRGLRPYSDLYVMSADGGAVRRLTHLAARIAGFDWAPDSSLIVLSSDHAGEAGLYAVDTNSGKLHDLHVTPAVFPSFARDEPLLVYQIPRVRLGLSIVQLGRPDIPPRQIAASTGSDRYPTFSPDSNRLAFISDRSGSQQLWIYDFARAEPTMLTNLDAARIGSLAWSPDGRHLLFVLRRGGVGRMVEIDLISGRRRNVAPSSNVRYADYAHDGHIVAIVHREDTDVLVRVDAPREIDLLRGVVFMQSDPQSGRIYYTRDDTAGLYWFDPASGQQQLVITPIALAFKDSWRIVGGRVWYLANSLASTPKIRVFDSSTGDELHGFSLPPQQQGFDRHYLDGGFDVSPDGTRMILGVGVADDTDIGMLRVTQNVRSSSEASS